jgi:hypothetical protein
MSFDLETVREALTEEQFTGLKNHVDDLIGQRNTARTESITGRKQLREEVETLRTFKRATLDKFGLDDDADISALPDPKADADAVKTFEARAKRLGEDLKTAQEAFTALQSKHQAATVSAALEKALGSHDFVDREMVGDYVRSRLTVSDEGGVMFRSDDGATCAIDEGIKTLVKARPHILKAAGAGGSGFNPTQGSHKDKTFAEMTLTERGALFKENPEKYQQLAHSGA